MRAASFLLFLSSLIALPALGLDVTLSVTSDGAPTPTVKGITNLPDGTGLMATVTRKSSGYMGQEKADVKAGAFSFGPFSNAGKPLNPGVYSLEIGTGIATVQPPAVIAIVGQDYSKLRSPNMKKDWLGRFMEFKSQFTVTGAVSPANDKIARDKEWSLIQPNGIKYCVADCNDSKRGTNSAFMACLSRCERDWPERKQ